MGFPQPTPGGGGGGLSNAYAFLTDGTHTASAAGSDTIDFVSPDGSVLFTVVPGSPGTVQAKVARPKTLLFSGAFSGVNSITTSASLIGGPITVLPASTLAINDLLHFHATGRINNSSGSSANVFVNININGQSDSTQTAKAMATGSNGNWNLDFWAVVTVAGPTILEMSPAASSSLLSPTSNLIVLADTAITPPASGLWTALMTWTNPVTFDVIGNTTVNNINMGFACLAAGVERFATGF